MENWSCTLVLEPSGCMVGMARFLTQRSPSHIIGSHLAQAKSGEAFTFPQATRAFTPGSYSLDSLISITYLLLSHSFDDNQGNKKTGLGSNVDGYISHIKTIQFKETNHWSLEPAVYNTTCNEI